MKTMIRVLFISTSLMLLANVVSTKADAQTKYFLAIDVPDCCRLSVSEWQRIAARLKARKVPNFFGTYRIKDYREHPYPVTITKTTARNGFLIVGPFTTQKQMRQLVELLTGMLPKADNTPNRIEPGVTGEPQTWHIGFFQIAALRS